MHLESIDKDEKKDIYISFKEVFHYKDDKDCYNNGFIKILDQDRTVRVMSRLKYQKTLLIKEDKMTFQEFYEKYTHCRNAILVEDRKSTGSIFEHKIETICDRSLELPWFFVDREGARDKDRLFINGIPTPYKAEDLSDVGCITDSSIENSLITIFLKNGDEFSIHFDGDIEGQRNGEFFWNTTYIREHESKEKEREDA